MNRRLVATALVVSFVFATGVSSSYAGAFPRRFGNNQNTGDVGNDTALTPTNVPDLKWVSTIPTPGSVNATPIVSDGLLFVGDSTGHFYVVDLATSVRLVNLDTTGPYKSTNPTALNAGALESTASMATVTVPDTTGSHPERRVYIGVSNSAKTLWCLNVDKILNKISTAPGSLQNDPGTDYQCSGPFPISLLPPGSLAPGSTNGSYDGTVLFSPGQSIHFNGQDGVRDVLYAPSTGYDCSDGVLYAIDALTGEKLGMWDPVVNGDGMGGVMWGSPAMSRDGRHLYIATGDCVQKPQAGEHTESLLSFDPADISKGPVWGHQRRLVDTADFDIGNSPTLVDVADPNGCHRIVSTDKDGCMYGFEQEIDIPQVGEPGFDPLRFGQQRVLWRTCFTIGSLEGGFDANAAVFHDRYAFAQAESLLGTVGNDNANAFTVDACTGKFLWASAAVAKGLGEAAIASGMIFQPSGSNLQVLRAAATPELLATVTLPSKVTPGGGGPSIADGRIYVPLAAGGVAVVAVESPGTNASPPQDVVVNFGGPYPEPLGIPDEQPFKSIVPNNSYPLPID